MDLGTGAAAPACRSDTPQPPLGLLDPQDEPRSPADPPRPFGGSLAAPAAGLGEKLAGMPPSLPEGESPPTSGQLPADAWADLCNRPFGVYVHVPYCRVRCGYCDFNTYALAELTGRPGATPQRYVAAVLAELDLAARVLQSRGSAAGGSAAGGSPAGGADAPAPGPRAQRSPVPAVQTVFFGGGTPTLLPAQDLTRLLDGIRQCWGLAGDAEVTIEANPDTMTPHLAQELAAAGFGRVSLGMQSAVPHVLATLERTHDPAGVARAVAAVRGAGLAVSVDLIYGTPGETIADWERSLTAAISLAPQHISAYALVVEEGTRLAARVRRGELAAPDDDEAADKYELADELLHAAGYDWYEVSNWARSAADACRHNLGYWRDGTWWGLGPGAHSHVGGVRWWNVKHPATYAARLAAGVSPAAGREVLTARQRLDERILLGVRLAEGLPVADLPAGAGAAVAQLLADGLIDGPAAMGAAGPRRVLLTRRGRLLADAVVRRLVST